MLAGTVYVNNEDQQGTIHVFESYTLHSKYNSSIFDYDIAVIRVKNSFNLKHGESLKAVRLPTQGMPLLENEDTTALGWGITESGRESSILLKSTLPLMEDKECNSFWSIRTNRMICAGVRGVDPCSGDSGGPLIFRGLQIGIISSGVMDCGSGIPSLFTSLTHPEIRQFIRDLAQV